MNKLLGKVSGAFGGKKDTPIFSVDDEIRIALLGKTGAGKSETGNTILGKAEFESKSTPMSVTQKCAVQSVIRGNKKVVLVDTPGLFDTSEILETTKNEVAKCITLTSPGVHCFLLVLQVGRFTPEEKNTVQTILKMFGENAQRYLIVLFTRVDMLEGDLQIDEKLKIYLQNIPKDMKEFLEYCENRYIGFNNRAKTKEKKKQVDKLFHLIEETVAKNGGSCYTSENFEETERKIKELIDRQIREREQEQKRQQQEQEERLRKQIEEEEESKNKKKLEEELARLKKEGELEREQKAKEIEEQLRNEMREAVAKGDTSIWSKLADGLYSFFTLKWIR